MRLAAFGLVLLILGGAPSHLRAAAPALPARAQPAHSTPQFDERAFALARARIRGEPVALPGVRALIVPHHWPAGDLIVRGLRDVAATGEYRRVILVGPDHPNAGGAVATTSRWPWRTPFGTIDPEVTAIQALTHGGLVRAEPTVIGREHSVAGLVPAVAYFLPHALLVPLVVRSDVRRAEAERLAAQLEPWMDERTILVLSVDFAHDLLPHDARRMDAESVAALTALDLDRALAYGNEHLDAPGAVAVTLALMRRLGSTRFQLRADRDGGTLPGYGGGPVTSYISGTYRR